MDMKKIVSILLTAVMLFSTVIAVSAADAPTKEYPQKFYDVPKDHWAFNYIAELADRGVIAGYEDGSFKPNNTVTRAEWAKIMVGAAGIPVVPVKEIDITRENTFHLPNSGVYDLDDNAWYYDYVNAAAPYMNFYWNDSYGYLFTPNQAAVREDVTMAMVKLKGYDLSNVDFSYLSNFTDTDSISDNIKQYVAVAVEKGLISGFEDNTFRGQATITRAEAATLLWRAFQYGNDNKVVDTPSQTVATPSTTQDTQVAPTPTPTQTEPVAEPTAEPTEEPTPEPTEKPYKVDTLVKADVKGSVYYTKDNSDNIYYVEEGTIYKLDVYSKSTTEVFDTSELNVDNDEMALSDFKAESLCYDTYKNRLLLLGSYNSVNAINKVNNHYLYEIDGNNTEIITDNYLQNALLIGTLSNGDFMDIYRIIDKETFKEKAYIGYTGVETAYKAYDFFETDSEIYFYGKSDYKNYYGFIQYDYNNTNCLWKTERNDFTAACTLNNKVILMTQNNEIYTYNFNGKELNKIGNYDYKVIDKSKIDFSNVKIKLIPIDSNIIFYDTSAKAFRIISEN